MDRNSASADRSSSASFLSLPCIQLIHLSLSLSSLPPLRPHPLLSLSDFCSSPLINTAEESSGIQGRSLSRSPTVEDGGNEKERNKEKNERRRSCLGEGETQTEVTNLSKSPTETETVTECQREGWERREAGRGETSEEVSSAYSQLMVPTGGDNWFSFSVYLYSICIEIHTSDSFFPLALNEIPS